MKRVSELIAGILLAVSVASCAVLPELDRHTTPDVEATGKATVELQPLPDDAVAVHALSGRASLVVVVGSGGDLWRWGARDSELGSPPWAGAVVHQEPLEIFPNRSWLAASAGAAHLVLVSRQGELFTWGNNTSNALGLGEAFSHVQFSIDANRIAGSQFWVAAYASGDRSYAITREGAVYAWGRNNDGSLGIGDRATRFEPHRIVLQEPVIDIAAGENTSFAITESGFLYGWGSNRDGELPALAHEFVETPVLLFPEHRWRVVASGNHRGQHAIATPITYGVSWAGRLYSWGRGGLNPAGVSGDPGGWVRVLVTQDQIIGLRSNGAVHAWLHGDPVPADRLGIP